MVIERGIPVPERVRAGGRPRAKHTELLTRLEVGESFDFRPATKAAIRGSWWLHCKGKKFCIRGYRVWRTE